MSKRQDRVLYAFVIVMGLATIGQLFYWASPDGRIIGVVLLVAVLAFYLLINWHARRKLT